MNFYRFIIMVIMAFFPLFSLHAQQPADGENEFYLAAVNPLSTGADTLTSDAGRGVWVAHSPDLDNDGMPEILVTEYSDGGRVFVYEVIGDDQMELVWVSPKLNPGVSGGGSTPRSVTTGDFDNNGRQEIIFPVGYFASDSVQFEQRGLYFYEWTGTDNDYGTTHAYKLNFEDIDTNFVSVSTGRTENGIRVQDIDGDGKSELLFPPRSFSFSVAKLYIMQVNSGTFSAGDAVVGTEYVYDAMVQANPPDGYVPVSTEIGDVDNDGLDEIIVAGWTNIAAGAGIGFIQIDGPDSYTNGSIIQIADFSAFVVKAKPIFAMVNGEPVIYLHGTNASLSASQMWVIDDIFSDAFVSPSDVTPLFSGVGFWSAWALGDQDHATASAGDGIDLYLYGGGGRLLDIEHDNSGSPADTNSYTITQLYDLGDLYDNLGGLFDDIYTYPGMDLDNDGNRDIVASYKGSGVDTLGGVSLNQNGYHVFFWEWGDSALSINPPPPGPTGIGGISVITPEDYRLAQNYPNPFNPSTTIEFALPINKQISLGVYNMLGQKVKTLVDNESYTAGTYQVQWDGTNQNGQKVASGVYVYRLTFGNFSKSMRMNLVR